MLIIPQVSKLLHHRSAAAGYTLLLALTYLLFPLLLAARGQPEKVSEGERTHRRRCLRSS